MIAVATAVGHPMNVEACSVLDPIDMFFQPIPLRISNRFLLPDNMKENMIIPWMIWSTLPVVQSPSGLSHHIPRGIGSSLNILYEAFRLLSGREQKIQRHPFIGNLHLYIIHCRHRVARRGWRDREGRHEQGEKGTENKIE